MTLSQGFTRALVAGCFALVAVSAACGGDPGTGVSFSGGGSIGGDTYSYTTYVDTPPNRSVDCTRQVEDATFTSVTVNTVVAEHDVGESFSATLAFDASTLAVSSVELTAGEQGMTYDGTDCTATVNAYQTNTAALDFEVTCTGSDPSGGPALGFNGAFTICNDAPATK